MHLTLRASISLLAAALAQLPASTSLADGPIGQQFEQQFTVPAGGFVEIAFEVDQPFLFLMLDGDGSSNLDLVLYTGEAGLLGIGRGPRDHERVMQAFTPPELVYVVVINWGKQANTCTLRSW